MYHKTMAEPRLSTAWLTAELHLVISTSRFATTTARYEEAKFYREKT